MGRGANRVEPTVKIRFKLCLVPGRHGLIRFTGCAGPARQRQGSAQHSPWAWYNWATGWAAHRPKASFFFLILLEYYIIYIIYKCLFK